MNFHQLRYILAVNEFRNFARAASHCRVAQSTLSKEIMKLEREFDVVIFDRTRRPVVPTMKGLELLDEAKILLDAQKRFIEIANQRKNDLKGEFRMGIHQGLAPYLLPLFLAGFVRRYPQLLVEVKEMNIKQLEAHLRRESIDLGITISPFEAEGFYEHPLFEEPFLAYIHKDHPLMDQEEITFEDICGDDLLLTRDISDNLLNRDRFSEEFYKEDRLPNLNYQSGSLETMRKIVELDGGVTLLPELAVRFMGDRRRKMIRVLQDPPTRTVSMVMPRGFEKKRILKALKENIMAHIPHNRQMQKESQD